MKYFNSFFPLLSPRPLGEAGVRAMPATAEGVLCFPLYEEGRRGVFLHLHYPPLKIRGGEGAL